MKTRISAIILILALFSTISEISYGTYPYYNPPPSVVITYPTDGAVFTKGDNITIQANAWDNGYITRVQFYANGQLLPGGIDYQAPYGYTWNNVPAGSYTLKAKAYDNGGKSTYSSPVNITVRNIWYVDIRRSGGGGSSWADAYKYLQDALNVAIAGDEIRVAEGTYKPSKLTTTDPRSATFQLINGVAIKGGYAGESYPDARDVVAYKTILSGDIGVEEDNADNAYHVVTGSGTNGTAVLDGFTIESGNANGGDQYAFGGGMYNYSGSPTITNCTFTINTSFSGGGGMYNKQSSSPTLTGCAFNNNSADSGGGMYNSTSSCPVLTNCMFSENKAVGPSYGDGGGMFNQSSSPVLINCVFSGNTNSGNVGGGMANRTCPIGYPNLTGCVFGGNQSANTGGGMANYQSSPTLTNCIFNSNKAVAFDGGGVNNDSSSNPTLSNCVFFGNSAGQNGGGMENYGSCSPALTNCTFTGNSTINYGGGIHNYDHSNPALTNCIFWNDTPDEIYNTPDSNPTVTYCCVQGGGYSGGTNIGNDPRFANVGDFHLGLDSPCINAGNPNGDYQGQTDIDGQPRVLCLRVDIGADEVPTPIHVNGTAASGGDGVSWARAHNNLQYVLTNANDGEEIWVAKGLYKPTTTNPSDRTASFVLNPNMSVYGGFNGDETSIDERKLFDNATASILSGDIDGDNVLDSDNSYHVVNGGEGAILDGFVIQGGYADGVGYDSYGGGVLNLSVSPIVRNCRFVGNHAASGGSMYNDSSIPQIVNCIFSGNIGGNGGGIYNNYANSSIVNCSFAGNTAANLGGAICNYESASSVVSSIIWGNTAGTGNSIYNAGSKKPYISYSDVEGCGGSPPQQGPWNSDIGIDGHNNIQQYPSFVNADGGDFHLLPGSPCIGTGLDGKNMGVNWPVDATVVNGPVAVTEPVDIVISPNGNIYVLRVVNPSSSEVQIYNDQLVQQGDPITVNVNNPRGIAVDADNKIYIADTGGNCIHKYDSGGSLVASFGVGGSVCGSGNGNGQFNGPCGIAVDLDGYIYVTDSGNNRVQIFRPNGDFDSTWGNSGQLSNPNGFCLVGSSKIYLADTGNNRIQSFAAKSGYFYGKVGEEGTHSGQFRSPQDVCYDLQFNELIVADTVNDRIQIFQLNTSGGSSSSEMTYAGQINEIAGLTPTKLSRPKAVACKSSNTKQILYIADTGHNRVVKVEVEKDYPGRTPLTPLQVLALFKAALWAGDINKAVTFILDPFADDYSAIFHEHSGSLQDLVNNMGEMSLNMRDSGMIIYEISDSTGTKFYPVVFSLDDAGNWEIVVF